MKSIREELTMAEEKLPLCVKLQRGQTETSLLDEFYNEVNSRVISLQENLAPYQETITKANATIKSVNEEIDALYDRITSLEEQNRELLDVVEEAEKTMDKIGETHKQDLYDYNCIMFEKIAKLHKVPQLAEKRDWAIDFQYYPVFQTIYITETPEEPVCKIVDEDDDGSISDWMGNINN